MEQRPQDHNWVAKNVYASMIRKYNKKVGETSDFGIIITEKFLDTLQRRYVSICSSDGILRV